MSSLRPIHFEPGCCIALDDKKQWIYLNSKKWALRVPGGFYRWAPQVERFRRELGFYVPKVLLVYNISFEVKLKEGVYSRWDYLTSTSSQRMLVTDPLIFISTARLIWISKADHKVRRIK